MHFCTGDLHNDIVTSSLSASEALSWLEDACREAYGNILCLAVWGTEYEGFPEQPVAKFREIARSCPRKFLPVLAFEDIHYVAATGLADVINTKPFYCSLTWNEENALAGGALSDGRLTELGRKTIRELGREAILIDTAHLNRASFWDVLEAADGGVLCSHTCFDAIRKHPRNLTDEQIEAVIARGGIVGLTLVGDFLTDSGKAAVEDVVRHIDHFTSRFPADRLAIGSDFFGTEDLPENIKNYKTYVEIVEKLLKIGYNGTVIQNLFYDNLYGFMKRRKFL